MRPLSAEIGLRAEQSMQEFELRPPAVLCLRQGRIEFVADHGNAQGLEVVEDLRHADQGRRVGFVIGAFFGAGSSPGGLLGIEKLFVIGGWTRSDRPVLEDLARCCCCWSAS